MSLSQLNTSKKVWSRSILELAAQPKRAPQYLKTLFEAGIQTWNDLVWIMPLRVIKAPETKPFSQITDEELFWGQGQVVGVKSVPAFGRRGKGKLQLFNITMHVQDNLSDDVITLKFFNSYPNQVKLFNQKKEINFLGKAQLYKGEIQISNPNINPADLCDENGLIVEYPTIAKIAGKFIKKAIRNIPKEAWESSIIEDEFQINDKLNEINNAFCILHGLKDATKDERESAKEKLIYYEFFKDQLKVIARKRAIKVQSAKKFLDDASFNQEIKKMLPYELTLDQKKVWKELLVDFSSGAPMMRMIQGDVGCGKTTLAVLASLLIVKNQSQVALMCPTETLARQHFSTFQSMLKDIKIELLVGSSKPKDKKEIYQRLETGDIDLVIGTHALIQDGVNFKDLQLAIIDEQHKFGVDQRLRLTQKGKATHNLILTATPIPRTLQLAQYGDLDISSIKTMPAGRKPIRTRIVKKDTYEKYLSFLKTRMSMGEQIYIVAPAIEESEVLNLKNVKEIYQNYKKFFPEFTIQMLHGKLKADEKNIILEQFMQNKVQMIISTTVIEVGINNTNATVMSIYNPDRFGLSSLHQLRGRVGRGSQAGFCFLVMDQKNTNDSIERLKILEQTTDGFEIAQADLENRGEGDLFGTDQSGNINSKKIASIFEHFETFNQVNEDLKYLIKKDESLIDRFIADYKEDTKITTTI